MLTLTVRKFCLSLACFFFAVAAASAQTPVTPVFRAILPDTLPESSGIEFISDTAIWSHNDSYHPGELFQIDTAGQLHRVLTLVNVPAVDVEDLAQDSAGWFYIGDFGNNNNTRTDLRIYKIPPPATIAADTVTPQAIFFSFADQAAFPPPAAEKNFDCEAMFHFHNQLYVFSKNRGTSTYARMYRMPDTAGVYNLSPVDSFDTQHWVTSADISESGTYMTLFSEWNIFVFGGFTGDQFFQGNVIQFTMSPYTQKEGVVFSGDTLLYLTDEKGLSGNGRRLYSLRIDTLMLQLQEYAGQDARFSLYPNPASDEVVIRHPEGDYRWNLLAADGKMLGSGACSFSRDRIPTASLAPGLYFIELFPLHGRAEKPVRLPLVRTR